MNEDDGERKAKHDVAKDRKRKERLVFVSKSVLVE
jgi:hypothetical protein